MTYQEINNLTVDTAFFTILERLVDFSEVPEGEDRYTCGAPQENETYYDVIQLHESLTLPPLQDFEDELVVYQAELTAEEDARIAEVNRKTDLFDRFETLYNRDAGLPCFYQIVSNVSNAHKYMKDLIEDQSQSTEAENLMSQIEAKDAEIVADINANAYVEERKDNYWPIGDQLDCLYKAFTYMKANGVDLGSDGDAWLEHIDSIKSTYPKPE